MDSLDYDEFSDFDVEAFLDQSQEREKQRLEAELEQIEKQLEDRDSLHEEIVEELESKLEWYLDRLERLYKQNRGKDGDRDALKTSIDEFYTEIREEKQMHWRDRQKLENARRKLVRELAELDDVDTVFDLL